MTARRIANVDIEVAWTSLAGALAGALRALGEPRSIAEIMGLGGLAFRLALPAEGGVLAAGPAAAAIDIDRVAPLLRNAGRRLEVIAGRTDDRDAAKRRERVLKQIRKGIDRGRPALAYDLHIPEFGIIHGYDDRAHTLTVSSMMSRQYGDMLPESRWPVPERHGRFIVLLLGDRERVDIRRALRDALRYALAYAEHGEPGDPTSATHGLAAWRRWREAFERGEPIDPSGHARLIQTVQAARHAAAAFLRATADGPAAVSLQEAAGAYDRVVLALSRMATLFPYPNGGDIDGQGGRIVALSALREAEAAERAALAHIEAALRML